ncbi:hypothetical protein [Pseudomonas citronellolis]|uniref:hypothetical protein n=1 Tax=Pseudomonas citronellolis TaxID=53408 RepID=UPI002D79F353|nr:hypothetical protein [Pseudomonas citronellolis]WRT85803.1 hypothetical protein VK748_15700 [Pseudomonas citronellolis]
MYKSILLCLLFTSSAFSDPIRSTSKCFTSLDGKINVKFVEITEPKDKVNLAYVKYEKSKKPIPLLLKSREEEILESDRPAAVTKKWTEFIDEILNGEYTTQSQGAQIYEFIYKGKNGKEVNFNYNTEATLEDYSGCNWEK